jgi:glycosyltransferase involved in cell wall biosynthesis
MRIRSSLIVPTYNGKQRIISFLHSLQLQTQMPDEVIVVVDGSSDGTVEAIEQANFSDLPLKVCVQENKGRPSARNTGLRLAQHELILSFDDDMVLTPNVVEYHLKHHQENPGTVCVGFQAEKKPKRGERNYLFLDFRYYLSQKWNDGSPQFPVPMSIYNYQLTTANCSFPKSIIDKVGYFDEGLKEVEDFDLGTRMIHNGITMYYRPEILAWHDNPDWDFTKFVERQIQYRKDDLTWLKKLEAEGTIPAAFRKHPRYTVNKRYPFLKKMVLEVLASPFWINLAEQKYFTILPKTVRYRFMDVITVAFTYTLRSPRAQGSAKLS